MLFSLDERMYVSQDPIGLKVNNPTLYGYVKDVNSRIDYFGLHDILSSTDIVTRGGTCTTDLFTNGAEEIADNGVLNGISTQAKPGASLEELSQPFMNGQVGVATVGDIEGAGGKITLDGKLNSVDGTKVMNHATIDGLTAEQLEDLFTPTQDNPIPKKLRGCK